MIPWQSKVTVQFNRIWTLWTAHGSYDTCACTKNTHTHTHKHKNFGDLLFQLTDGCLLLHNFVSKSRHLLLVGITKLIHLNFQGYSHLICLFFFFCLFLTGYSMNLFWTHIQRINSLVSNVLIISYPAKFLSSGKIHTTDHQSMVLALSLLKQTRHLTLLTQSV